jgi:hypothetical protein
MARVRASITVECPSRAAHGAAIVRLVQVAPAARPRTHTQSAHAATCAPIYKYRRSPPCHGRAHAHTRAHTCTQLHARTHARTHTNTQTHTRTRKHHRTARENKQLAVNAESRARAQIRTARICSWAHGRYRRGGSLGASAGTHGHAQQSRAAPRGRLVATSERAAEPRRHPSLVRRRFLPRQPRASARGRSGNRPQCESALVGNVQAASGPGDATECVRVWEGMDSKAAAAPTRAAALIATSAAPPAAAAAGADLAAV